MGNFRDLKVWQKADALATDIITTTDAARWRNRADLRSQSQRAAASIPANIAEARSGRSDIDQVRVLRIAVGSCNELETHLLQAKRVRFLRPSDVDRLISQVQEVRKMLSGLIRYLSGKPSPAA
jgi:four helix bundle protein